uniref:Uncharacterized protein n=1 Tax=Anguilla anguilla TaxID=7936 RepID=A0A0E9P950_ANGAN
MFKTQKIKEHTADRAVAGRCVLRGLIENNWQRNILMNINHFRPTIY